MSKTRSRFATALQQARLGARLTQEQLVEMLHVNQRTAISWETGERIPSIGMVFLLCMIFAGGSAASTELFSLELLIPYLLDDLERQKKFHQEGAFQELVAQGIQKLLQVAESLPQPAQASQVISLLPEQPAKSAHQESVTGSISSSQPHIGQREAESADVEQIFTLLERLRTRPDLIPVVNDFLDQMLLV
jgi:transcriptional regulator with XRE-family HTH domain